MSKIIGLALVMGALLFLATMTAQAGGKDGLQEEMMGRFVANLAYFQGVNFDDLDQAGVNRRLDSLFEKKPGHPFRKSFLDNLQARINAERNDEVVVVTATNNILRIASTQTGRVCWLRIHPTKVRDGNVRVELLDKAPTQYAKGLSAK